jgi:hypothetical protein
LRNCLIIFALIVFVLSKSAQSQNYIISEISVKGNNKTKKEVILKELEFSEKDSIEYSKLEKLIENSEQNLLRTSLFNYVNLTYEIYQDLVFIEINLEERWYFWFYPIFEHGSRNLSSFIIDKDLSRINYGAVVELHNIKGENNFFRIKLRGGFRQHYSLSLFLQNFEKTQNHGLKISAETFIQKNIVSKILDNKAVYEFADFLNFNSYFIYSFRININNQVGLGMAYKHYLQENINTTEVLEQKIISDYFNPLIYYNFDSRNNKVYANNGFLINTNLGYWYNLNNCFTSFVGYNLDFQAHKTIDNSRFAIHTSNSYKYYKEKNSQNPYFQAQLEFGKDFWIRGYEYYYFIGNNSVKTQNTLSFLLSKTKIHNLPNFLPKEFKKAYTKIYLEAFGDLIYTDGYNNVFNANNEFNKKINYTFGLGLSIETYYERLLQINLTYIPNFSKIGIFVNYQTPLIKLY